MLTSTEKSQLTSLVKREGGWNAIVPQIEAAVIADRKQAGLDALAGAVTLTVNDWAKVRAVFQAAGQYRLALTAALDDVIAAGTAGDATALGPALVLLAAAAQGHLR